MRKKYISITLIIVLLVGALVTYNRYQADLKVFTPQKWNQKIYKRYLMLDDLQKKYDLYRMDHQEVIALLGKNGLESDSGQSISIILEKDILTR